MFATLCLDDRVDPEDEEVLDAVEWLCDGVGDEPLRRVDFIDGTNPDLVADIIDRVEDEMVESGHIVHRIGTDTRCHAVVTTRTHSQLVAYLSEYGVL